MTREEIIKGLLDIHVVTANYKGDQVILHNMPMPKLTEILYGAAELLKAQEPRVMTLEEILSSDGAVWILDRDDKGCEIHIAFPLRKRGELDPAIEFRSREPDMLEHRLIRDYLLGWCCWTSRPTDKQREATPWEVAPCGTPGDEMRRKAEWGIKH